MARSQPKTYDPTTGAWRTQSGGQTLEKTVEENVPSGGSSKSTPSVTPVTNSGGGGKLTASNTNPETAQGSAEQKANTIEYNVLQGTLNYIPTPVTIKIKAGDTVNLQGFGSYLSGLYYVQDVTRKIDSNGYTHSATVIKTDFGDSLKAPQEPPVTNRDAQADMSAQTETRTYTLQRGECLWTVAEKFYGNGSLYTKIASANNISPSQYTNLPIGLQLTIP